MSLSPLGWAIQSSEGYGIQNAIPTTHNNPGDITDANGNIITFPSYNSGASALQSQIDAIFNGESKNYSPSMTLSQMGNVYANDPNWGNNVASKLGVSPDTTLSQLQNMGLTSTSLNSAPSSLSSKLLSMLPSANTDLATRSIMLVVGLLLITAGLFSFKTTQTIIETGGKIGKKGAEYGKIFASL